MVGVPGHHTIFPDGKVPDKVAIGSETSYPYPPVRYGSEHGCRNTGTRVQR